MTQPGQGTPKLMGLLILGMLVTATVLVSMESYCTLQDKVEIELQPATEETQPLTSDNATRSAANSADQTREETI